MLPPSSSTMAPSMSALVSISSTRMPFCVPIWRKTMNVPTGMTRITRQATETGSWVKMVTTAARPVKTAGAKSMNISLMSLTVPSRLRLRRPWMLPVMWLRKYESGASSSDSAARWRAIFSACVAVSSTISLRATLMSSLTTLTIRMATRIGTTDANEALSPTRTWSVR